MEPINFCYYLQGMLTKASKGEEPTDYADKQIVVNLDKTIKEHERQQQELHGPWVDGGTDKQLFEATCGVGEGLRFKAPGPYEPDKDNI